MLLLRRAATRVGSSTAASSSGGLRQALPARALTASAAGGGGSGKDDGSSSSGNSSGSSGGASSDRERDPFGFRELKAKYSGGGGGGGGKKAAGASSSASPDFPPVTAEDAAAVEGRLARAGKVGVGRNVFGIEGVSREMTAAWEAGVLPPQLHARDSDQLLNRHMEGPEDLYWPTQTETNVPRDEEALFPTGQDRVYSPEEMREMAEAEVGGVCEGRRQRRGNQPLLCRKVDLEEVAFSNVALLARFLSPAGQIKPRRVSGLCAKCQRKVARTIKHARHVGMIPHTSGVELYRRLPPVGEGEGEAGGVPLARPGAGGGGGQEGRRREEALKRVPAVTI